MNANASTEQGSRCREQLESYGRAFAFGVMSGSAVLLVLDKSG